MHEGRRQTGRRPAHAGSRLKLIDVPGRSRLIRQPSSRTGENPPYGMIGGIEETSASFEARSAPRSHPTIAEVATAGERPMSVLQNIAKAMGPISTDAFDSSKMTLMPSVTRNESAWPQPSQALPC